MGAFMKNTESVDVTVMDSDGVPTGRPSVSDLTGDNPLAKVARENWLIKTAPKLLPNVVDKELWTPLAAQGFPHFSLMLLEQLQTLERYLWPTYVDDATNNHVLLLVLIANVKRHEHLPLWSLFSDRPDAFQSFFRRVLHLSIDFSLPTTIRTHILIFIIGAFQSLDNGPVRRECAPLVGIGIWHHLHSEAVKELHLSRSAQVQKAARAAKKKLDTAEAATQNRLKFERSWLYTLLLDFLDKLYDEDAIPDAKRESLLYCERFLELLCDLQSQLPTRRYVNTLLRDLNLLPTIRLSSLYATTREGALLREQVELLSHYTYFPINDQSGMEMSRQDLEDASNARVAQLQKIALRMQPEKLKLLVLANFGSLTQRNELKVHLDTLSDDELVDLCRELSLRTDYPEKSLVVLDRAFFIEILVSDIERKPLYLDRVQNDMPSVPTEKTLYHNPLIESESYDESRPLALPKMTLQYLSVGDFLYRSFVLYRIEAFHEIRKHVEDTIKRLKPRRQNNTTRFDGFSNMAIPIGKPAIIDRLPAKVGQDVSAEVKVEVILDVSRLQPGLRRDWESLRPDDVVFLIAVHPNEGSMRLTNGHQHESQAEKIGIKTLRCAEVISIMDESGRLIRQDHEQHDQGDAFSKPRQRRLLLRIDAAAYKRDQEKSAANGGDIYQDINLIVRRRARENNFKPVLDSIRQLTIANSSVPAWLKEVFLGFGDPASASYQRLSNRIKKLDFQDTFLDWQHLIESFPGKTIEPDPGQNGSFPPPYVLQSSGTETQSLTRPNKKRRREHAEGSGLAAASIEESFQVSTYQAPNKGPYIEDTPKLNRIRFTPSQISAIMSGTQPGLTVIVGPPGTGKTDVATQIMNNIYHNFPHERTLLIAHSNQALNQLFQKIMALDIDERHLLRLGHGEEELQTDVSYSKAGRVDWFLERGGQLLSEVQRLAASINAPGAHGNSCETAEYFDRIWIRPRWKQFWQIAESATLEGLIAAFPFHGFFANAPQPLFAQVADKAGAMECAKGCETHIRRIFDELADIRPFEILRTPKDRSNYLLVKEARIVAMTSTHAAMRRYDFAALGFRYDNVVVEEAAQITEIETFIPLVLQSSSTKKDSGQAQLKRVVLIGDHLQNSPVIQSIALRSYANLEQSLFQRLVRLGVPHIQLDAQGRSRPSLAALYKWRYPTLTNLHNTSLMQEFHHANAGLRYEYQFIDVPDYKGRGESEPTPHFLQNLGEAEYAVALYQYMRLLGYPAERISILCTYAGQRALLRDVLAHRCKGNKLFGMPAWVGTVDKYQGEQNDYIILSLVRTRSPGYLRDIRRLTVALSRARLGLYVFGRRDVFESSLELRDAFAGLLARSGKLTLVTDEMFPTQRTVEESIDGVEMQGLEHLGEYVYIMTQAKVKALKEGSLLLPPEQKFDGLVDKDDEGSVDDDDPPAIENV